MTEAKGGEGRYEAGQPGERSMSKAKGGASMREVNDRRAVLGRFVWVVEPRHYDPKKQQNMARVKNSACMRTQNHKK